MNWPKLTWRCVLLRKTEWVCAGGKRQEDKVTLDVVAVRTGKCLHACTHISPCLMGVFISNKSNPRSSAFFAMDEGKRIIKPNHTSVVQRTTKSFVSSREDAVSGQVSWIIRVSSPVCQLGFFQWKPWYLPSPGIAKHIVCAVNSVINLTSSLRQLSMKECYSLCSGMISDQATCAHFLKQIRARFAWLHRGRAVTILKQTGTVQIA